MVPWKSLPPERRQRYSCARDSVTDLKEALRRYLSKGGPGYVQKEVLPPEECIRLAHEAGGLIFVAHLHQIDPASPEHCVQLLYYNTGGGSCKCIRLL